jgi:hypothetical protein
MDNRIRRHLVTIPLAHRRRCFENGALCENRSPIEFALYAHRAIRGIKNQNKPHHPVMEQICGFQRFLSAGLASRNTGTRELFQNSRTSPQVHLKSFLSVTGSCVSVRRYTAPHWVQNTCVIDKQVAAELLAVKPKRGRNESWSLVRTNRFFSHSHRCGQTW